MATSYATSLISSYIAVTRFGGSVRDASKSKWLQEELFPVETANGSFEIVPIKDMAAEGAFREAIRGVAAIAHVATINNYDPNKVIPQAVAGVVNALEAASKESSIKDFVFASTVGAAAMPVADAAFQVGPDSWNDLAVKLAQAPPPYEPERAVVTYIASKVEAEKALWTFVAKKKPPA